MKLSQYVDTKIGTLGDDQTTSYHGGGKTYPGAARPFGMVQFSPDTCTGGDNGAGYSSHHKTIEGFSINHLSGIGWYGDLGNFQVMPSTGEIRFHSGTNEHSLFQSDGEGYASSFSHDSEITRAGYYSVKLDTYDINVEATATARCGFLRINYGKAGCKRVQVSLSRRIGGRSVRQKLRLIGNDTLSGEILCTPEGGGFGHGQGNVSYCLHFYAKFNLPWSVCGAYSLGNFLEKSNSYEGEDLGFYAEFPADTQQLLFKTGISYVDSEGAYKNLQKELKHWDFDLVVSEAGDEWERTLGNIIVEGSSEERKKIFYTTLYHTKLDPRMNYDCDRRYINAAKNISTCTNYQNRTIFSGWDVFRSQFPLLTLTEPGVVNDMLNTLIDIALQTGGTFPRWELLGNETGCMIGDPGVIIAADAYMKNIRSYDAQKSYELCKKTALGSGGETTRRNAEEYLRLGYVPCDISSTLENTFADWAIYRFASMLGDEETAKLFKKRAQNYKNIFDSAIGWMRRKDSEGNWCEWSSKYDENGCTESNIFQQTFFVPHDIDGLAEIFGKERFIQELESLFSGANLSALWNDNYNHSNEPCHHIAHMFNYVNLPERTQYWVRRIQNEAYQTGYDGFCGNEDVGQMSAWYVMTALGFHQTAPGRDRFDLNTPLFKRAVLTLDSRYHGRKVADTLEIITDKDPEANMFINKVYLNSNLLNRNYVTYEEITNGGKLEFHLANSIETIQKRGRS